MNKIPNAACAIARMGWFCLLLLLLLCGCAKFPATGGGPKTKRLTFTLTFADDVRLGLPGDSRGPGYYYIVLIDTDSDVTTGPVPVIGRPWGNGYAAGHYTYFVLIGNQAPFLQPLGQFIIFKLLDPDTTQNQPVAVGNPVSSTQPQVGDRILRFELDSSQIADVKNPNPTFLNVNILAVNRIPIDPNDDGGGRFWDALGNSQLPGDLNRFVKVDLTQDGVYDNQYYGQVEPPPGDVSEPALDIVNFAIQVSS